MFKQLLLLASILFARPLEENFDINTVSTTVECLTFTLQNAESTASLEVVTECETIEVTQTFEPTTYLVTETTTCSDTTTDIFLTTQAIPTETTTSSIVVETTTDIFLTTQAIPTETCTDTSAVTNTVTVTIETEIDCEETLVVQNFPTVTSEEECEETLVYDDEVAGVSSISEVRLNGLDFCQAEGLGDFLANGTQINHDTCSLTTLGSFPSVDNMVSTIILEPLNNDKFPLGVDISIVIKTINIDFGYSDDPTTMFQLYPQELNDVGYIKGHSHVAIQQLSDKYTVPSAKNPFFFESLTETSTNGELSTIVDGRMFTEKGEYRLCTSTSSQSHQPVLMGVARRGFADDCVRFNII